MNQHYSQEFMVTFVTLVMVSALLCSCQAPVTKKIIYWNAWSCTRAPKGTCFKIFFHARELAYQIINKKPTASLALKRSPYHPTLPLFDPSPNLYYYLHMFYFFKVSFPKGRIKAIDLHFRIFSFTGSRRVLVGESIFFLIWNRGDSRGPLFV